VDRSKYKVEDIQSLHGDDVSLEERMREEMAHDPYSINQWSLFSVTSTTEFQTPDIDVVRAWAITKGSAHVKIYFWDSGIEKDPNSNRPYHPDLRDRVTSYFDAIHPGQYPIDENGHGTHVAGIAAAMGDNDVGIKGVIPGPVQLGIGRFLNAQNQGDSGLAYQLAEWTEQDMAASRAADPDIKFVMSHSWGGGYSEALEQKMSRLVGTYDVIAITSAGNDHLNVDQNPYFPCRFRMVANICVAASDFNDLKTSFSSFGMNTVHLMAPGLQIFSIIPTTFVGPVATAHYQRKDGTSQAVPHVAGVAALIRSANPALSATQVQDILVRSVDVLPQAATQVINKKHLNAYRALLMAIGGDPNGANRTSANQFSSGSGGCSMQITDNTTAPGSALFLLLLSAVLWIAARRAMNAKPIPYRNFSINN
jgi:subtilisin family serine protease